jgi:hypothetical protein
MIGIAISLLWLCIGILILGGVIYIVLMVIRRFFAIPANVEFVIWAVFGILILIFLLMAVEGGGVPHGFGSFR